ncbi:MAG: anaerobic ribonucleoside-triphosphate reductase activating protein [Candidatus Heimdallarchaeaceae archaeon]
MIIGGLQKVSLIDYPDKISSVVFTQGCNFRCPYCHNPELVLPDIYSPEIATDKILSFLSTRVQFIDAVVITGGEPTLHADLPHFIKKIKEMGFLVKLDTNGSNPSMIKKLIDNELIDYIAMDVKAPLHLYPKVAKTKTSPDFLHDSISYIIDSPISYEFRTTVVKSLLSLQDIIDIGKEIIGAKKYVIQRFNASKTLDSSFKTECSYTTKEFEAIKKDLNQYVAKVNII